MIKAKFRVDGKTLYFFGVSEENIKRLKKGGAIRFNGSEMGIDGEVVIQYGETEEAIVAALGLKPVKKK